MELGEVLEHFQCKTDEEIRKAEKEPIADEIADVVIYFTLLAHELDGAVERKLRKGRGEVSHEHCSGRGNSKRAGR
ncbi:MazG-like family protein [Thermococcus sp.]